MKKTLITIAQILITVGILYFVFRDAEKRALMAEALRNADGRWFLTGLAVFSMVFVFAAWRWLLLLRAQQIEVPFPRVIALFMIGMFFNLFMLGATGGDVVKIYLLLKETQKKAAAFLTVVMDRVIGLIAIVCIAVTILVIRHELLLSRASPAKEWVVPFLIILGGSIGGLIFSMGLAAFGLAGKLPQRFPMREKFIELQDAYLSYAKKWRASLGAFVLSIGAHFAFFTGFWCAARAFTDKASLLDMFSVMPIVNTITAVPITIAGVGLREKIFEDLLSELYGIAEELGVLISITGFLFLVIWSAFGGVIYAFYRSSRQIEPEEMEEQMEEIEERLTGES